MSDLRGMTAPEKVELGNTGKIVGAAVVAIAICAGGAYFYEAGTGKAAQRNQVVASNDASSQSLQSAAPAIAPQQPVAVPAPAPESSNAQNLQPLQSAPKALTPPLVKTARIHAQKYTPAPSAVAPMPDNNATPATPPAAPPASSLSEQPAQAPAMDSATPTVPVAPSQVTPDQSSPQQSPQRPDQQNTDQQNSSALPPPQ